MNTSFLHPTSAFLGLITLVLSSPNLCANPRSSANYTITAETVDGGGAAVTSANYSTVASVEPSSTGRSATVSYAVEHGFIADGGTFTVILTAYELWAAASGLTPGVNDGLFDIAVPGGKPNIQHFAFDTDPLTSGGSDEGKSRTAFVDVGGTGYFSITLPVRAGATFVGTPSPTATIDGISYQIEGSGDLLTWLLSVSEVTPADDAGLPALRDIESDGTPDWEYRTFILDDETLSRGFLRGAVQPAP